MALKNCVVCGKKFSATGKIISCSQKCKAERIRAQDRARYVRKTPVLTAEQRVEQRQRQMERQRERSRAFYYKNRERVRAQQNARVREMSPPQVLPCVICGTPYTKKKKALTCSPECSATRKREMAVRYRLRAPIEPPLVKNCIICNEPYPRKPNVVTCSKECRAEHTSALRRADYARKMMRLKAIEAAKPKPKPKPKPKAKPIPKPKPKLDPFWEKYKRWQEANPHMQGRLSSRTT